jgi:hypothetical protein
LSLTKAAGDVSRIKLDRPFDAARRCGASCAVTKPFLAVLVGLAACSSGPKQPKPEPPKTDPVVTQPDPDPQPPQLADAELCPRLIERFKESAQMDADASAKVIAVVERHCASWPEPVRRCLATASDDAQQKCMDDLEEPLRDAFIKDLMASLREPPPCDELGYTAAMWVKLPDAATPHDRDVATAAIRSVIVESCRASAWSVPARICIADASADPRACLDADAADKPAGAKLDADLKLRHDLFAAALAWKPADKKIACDKVVAAHYGDAQWKTKLADRPKKDKAKVIKASAKAMAKACKDDSWTPFLRGCVISAKGEEQRGWCLDTTNTWGYPASAVEAPAIPTGSTGVPECDAYIAAVTAYAACDKVPQAAKDAVRQSITAMRDSLSPTMGADEKAAAVSGCTSATESLRQGADALGCKL